MDLKGLYFLRLLNYKRNMNTGVNFVIVFELKSGLTFRKTDLLPFIIPICVNKVELCVHNNHFIPHNNRFPRHNNHSGAG